jgi:hypothetical protein
VHSMRSTRSYLARPMSDISYVDEDTLSPTAAAAYPPPQRRSTGSGSGSNNNLQSKISRSGCQQSVLVADSTNTTNNHHLRVEAGSSYRLQRQQQAQQQAMQQQQQPQASTGSKSLHRQSADAQTQSAESSFSAAQLNHEEELTTNPPCVQIVSSSPQPPPRVASPLLIQPMVSASPLPGAGTAVTVQHAGGALQTHLLPSPIYGFGYDPTYCQYLGQGADGYQYELVRRPSIGHAVPPVELLLPTNSQPGGGMASPIPPQRRPSGGIPYLTPNSMQGSFDSAGGPPGSSASPIFIQQPLSPRHLHHSPLHQHHLATNTVAQQPPGVQPPGGGGGMHPPNASSNEIPKLIHETSI